ncbi:MAG: tRNA (adenosine(37)-N6)-dimethylallyltransferase MiaA [Akkermansiaceae bacterium]|nr:tRNA (adenosine(37)-N6)-dimethylallyltransferase MiaA [Akkermansiaceae bacterium]NNM28637.1 tRNA (adenosine(37)-N6)-dimethylallyltransferase MiaA [Akkermansiaceae bacterium]
MVNSCGRAAGPAPILPPPAIEPNLYICGPTASGKSSAALAIAEACGGEIVNADAFQLYRGLETLTAAPGPDDLARVPHHLYGRVAPGEALDAGRYREMALPVIEEIRNRGHLPVIVGGSGLYLKFLTHGPSPLPPADPGLRAELEALPLEELNLRLEAADPVEAARIDRNNPRYVQRALEICLLAGRPVSELRRSFAATPAGLRGILLEWSPAALEERIRTRTAAIVRRGALEEVAALPAGSPTASKAIGVPEIRDHLAGRIDLPACEERIVVATRQYAKRQRTWFRRESWLTRVDGAATPDELLAAVRGAGR